MLVTTSSDRLTQTFDTLRRHERRALVAYITAGHPDLERSLELLRGLADHGADIVEVGVPFSDPMADGPIIQRSSQRALAHGMTFDATLELIARARLDIPVVLFSYLNPVLAAGPDALHRAADAGAHGVIITDLPLGADPELEKRIGAGPLAFVRLAAPTTPAARLGAIARHGRGFVYLISRLGVTGVRRDMPPDLVRTVARVREATDLPICVGFGISHPDQAKAVARLADGVVVGSAIVREADTNVAGALKLVRALRGAIDDVADA